MVFNSQLAKAASFNAQTKLLQKGLKDASMQKLLQSGSGAHSISESESENISEEDGQDFKRKDLSSINEKKSSNKNSKINILDVHVISPSKKFNEVVNKSNNSSGSDSDSKNSPKLKRSTKSSVQQKRDNSFSNKNLKVKSPKKDKNEISSKKNRNRSDSSSLLSGDNFSSDSENERQLKKAASKNNSKEPKHKKKSSDSSDDSDSDRNIKSNKEEKKQNESDDDSSDDDSSDKEVIPNVVQRTKNNQAWPTLADFLRDNSDMEDLDLDKFKKAMKVSSNEDIYLLQIPSSIEPNELLDKSFSLNKKSKIKLDQGKYILSQKEEEIETMLILSDKLESVTPKGVLKLEKYLKFEEHLDIKVPLPEKQKLPENIKVRHPLFGADYKAKIELEKEIEERLQKALKRFEAKPKKSKKKVQADGEKNELIFKILEERCNNISDILPPKDKDTAVKTKKNKKLESIAEFTEEISSPIESNLNVSVKKKKKKKSHHEEVQDEETALTEVLQTDSSIHKKKKRKHSVSEPTEDEKPKKKKIDESLETEIKTELNMLENFVKKKKKKKNKKHDDIEEGNNVDNTLKTNKGDDKTAINQDFKSRRSSILSSTVVNDINDIKFGADVSRIITEAPKKKHKKVKVDETLNVDELETSKVHKHKKKKKKRESEN